MRKPQSVALILICVLHAQSTPSPKDADIRTLFTQLNDPGTTDHAAQQILRSGSKDPSVRSYIVEKLPDMIAKPRMDQVWRNAVRLAGQLKASNSVPTLVQALPRSPFKPSIILFGEILSLDSDPVGKALYEIGDPAVPALADLLEHDRDSMNRWRAARILWNIDSVLSRKALDNDLQHETDPAIKQFTEGKSAVNTHG